MVAAKIANLDVGRPADNEANLPNRAAGDLLNVSERSVKSARAVQRTGLTEVPCHVREMSDDDAYMALALNNAQRELNPLEVGLHALRSPLSVKAYADRSGFNDSERRYLSMKVNAAEASEATGTRVPVELWRHLAEIHAAPRWLMAAAPIGAA